MVSHLLVYNNPNLGASLSDHGAHYSAYGARLNELELLTMRAGNEELTSQFAALKSRINCIRFCANTNLADYRTQFIKVQVKTGYRH